MESNNLSSDTSRDGSLWWCESLCRHAVAGVSAATAMTTSLSNGSGIPQDDLIDIVQNDPTLYYIYDSKQLYKDVKVCYVESNYDGDTLTLIMPVPYAASAAADASSTMIMRPVHHKQHPKHPQQRTEYIKLVRISCRLYGLNTAEIRSKDAKEKAKAMEAKEYVKNRCVGKLFYCEVICPPKSKPDPYGRPLVKLFREIDSNDNAIVVSSVNEDMINLGYAKEYYGTGLKEY